MRVAVIGAGIAGLACAEGLRQRRIETVLFDKGKRSGGRLSSLRLDHYSWDFGAQYLTVGQGGFAAQVARWRQAGLVAPWIGGPAGALVGVPDMASLIAAQCRDHDLRFGAQVTRAECGGQSWFVSGPNLSEGPFAALIVAIPAEQAVPLLSLHDLAMAREAAAVRSRPCWAVMAGFDRRLAGLPDHLSSLGPVAWAARNNSKPERPSSESWVIQAGAEWSQRNLECDREVVAHRLLELFGQETGIDLPAPDFLKAHRWRFALPYGQPGKVLWNPQLRLGACGDWCYSGQIEAAWQSGADLADRLAQSALAEPAGQAREAR